MAKLKVISSEPDFPWRDISIPEDVLEEHTVMRNKENWREDPEYELLFLPSALQELQEFIGWGNLKYKANRVEQIGFLAGKHYLNKSTQKKLCVVDTVLPIPEAVGSSCYIEYSAEMMMQAMIRLGKINDSIPNEIDKKEIIGWFHTHPNGLQTFMSGTDMLTQHRVFNQDFNYSVVLNPHTLSWKAFRGREAEACMCRWMDVMDLAQLDSATPFEN